MTNVPPYYRVPWWLRLLAIPVCLFLLAAVNAGPALGVEPPRGAGEAAGPSPVFMPDVNRYATYRAAPPEKRCPIPNLPVSRETYFRWLEFSRHFGYADHAETHGVYGPRHYLPVLAKYVQSGEEKYGQACLRMLEQFDNVVREKAAKDGWHEMFGPELPYLGIYRRYLVSGGIMKQDDPRFRETVLRFARTLHPWATPVTHWRGPMHRAQGEGVVRSLASKWYPDIPEASDWLAYSSDVYQDWWRFRDFPQNDTGYLYGTLTSLFLHAWLTDNDAFFNDPGMKPLWDRLVHEVSPDGSISPYGAHGGWNSTAGMRIALLEMLATKTRDGTYRFVAHRLMNYLIYQRARYREDHILLGPESTEPLSLAYLFSDDSVRPVEPPSASRVLTRKETLRYRGFDKDGPSRFLGQLDPDPKRNVVDCGLIVTDEVKPSKLVLRSGWNPGDFFVLVDLFPRHDPVNTPGILGMTRWGAALTGTVAAKDFSDENRLVLATTEKLSGPQPKAISETEIVAFEDSPLATFATIRVTNYDGSVLVCTRHFLFVKNEMLLIRDDVTAGSSLTATLASVFNTQNVGPVTNGHAALTYVSQPVASSTGLLNPIVDLLVFHSPRPGGSLTAVDRLAADRRTAAMPVQLRYAQGCEIRPGMPAHFTTLFRPQPPANDHRPVSSAYDPTVLGRFSLDTSAISVIQDDQVATVIRVGAADKTNGDFWLIINPTERALDHPSFTTASRAAVVIDARNTERRQWTSKGKPLQFRQTETREATP